MQLGILSDTHGCAARTSAAAALFRHARATRLIHCGDIGDESVAWILEGFAVDFVEGNVDRFATASLAQAVREAGHTWHGALGTLTLEGRRIAFLHGDDHRTLQATIAGGQFDLVCHGHTHVAACYRHGHTLVVNPGAVYRSSSPSVAIVDLPEMEVRMLPLDER